MSPFCAIGISCIFKSYLINSKAFKDDIRTSKRKEMNPRIRIVLAFALLVFFATLIWKPQITGSSVGGERQEVVVILKPQAQANGITGALAVDEENVSLEVLSVQTKQAQEEVLGDVNAPSFIEQLTLQSGEPDAIVEREMQVVPAMVVDATPEGLEKLTNHPLVEAVYPNLEFELLLAQSVPIINADDVWTHNVSGTALSGSNVSVCVIDTGIQADHPAFGDRVVNQKCYCSSGCCPGGTTEANTAPDTHSVSHGTHVSGIIAANDAYKGVAPSANIVAVKVCNQGCGLFDILSGIDYCLQVKETYNVVALSGSIGDGGNYQTQGNCPTYFDVGLAAAKAAGITNVFASGNNGHQNGISYPGCNPDSIAVGATDKSDNIASFSNRGSLLEVLAPGVSITSAKASSTYGSLSGTSQATPHVSGAVALMKQYAQLKGLSLTPDDVKNVLISSGSMIGGFPRIDVLAALNALGLNETGPTVAITNPQQNATVTNPVVLEGNATDDDDGIIANESLSWKEGNVTLGNGSVLSMNFSAGVHTVTLQAMDSGQNSGEASVSFRVPTCVADVDFTDDGVLNIGDMVVFLTKFFSDTIVCEVPESPRCAADLDMTGNGAVELTDVVTVLTAVLQNNMLNSSGSVC